jgi:acyl-CoA dehydrogenase
MSVESELLLETVERLFTDLCKDVPANDARAGGPLDWSKIEDSGIGSLLVPEGAGGFGGSYQDAYAVIARAGWHALSLPIAETILARAILAGVGIDPPAGPATIAIDTHGALGGTAASGFHYSGALHAVPWGGRVEHVLVEVQHRGTAHLICLSVSDARRRDEGMNIAGEPRDRLEFEAAPLRMCAAFEPAPATQAHGGLIALGALLRVAAIAGALDWVLQQCLEHAAVRRQFGRTLSEFQVIQHALALLAEESAAITCSALAACRAADLGDAHLEIAAAKLRASQAIGAATAIAHQVHGAVGCTHEHALQRRTRRLWSWRIEFGGERDWALKLGASVVAAGAERLWPILTARGDRLSVVDSAMG